MSAGDLCERFGVNKSTTSAKTRRIFDALDIGPYDPRWCLPSKLDDNPPAWLIEVDGLIVDARSAPRRIQEEAFRLGLIPHLPRQEPAAPDNEPTPEWPEHKQPGGQPPRCNFLLNPCPCGSGKKYKRCCGSETHLSTVDDIAAAWAHGRALHHFQMGGDTPSARRTLGAAKTADPHVPAYLSGQKPLPEILPAVMGIGDEREGVICASEQMEAWHRTPKTLLVWLRKNT